MIELNKEYWNQRYHEENTGWDLGQSSPSIQAYFDQVDDKSLRILIPGAGNGHDVIALFEKGFHNVHLLDYAAKPVNDFLERYPHFPANQVHIEDFFQHEGDYDIIVEQTLFCAIDPILRNNYAQKVSSLLVANGKLIGVLFNRSFEGGPPFGGNKEEYSTYFNERFSHVVMEECYNSAEPRKGSELFIQLVK